MELWTGAHRAFAVKAFYKNGDSFVIARREFWRIRDSSQLCCSISPCHQDLGSKLRGYWFYAVWTLASDSPSDTEWRHAEQCGLLSMASLTTTIFSGVRTVLTLPPFFLCRTSSLKVLNPGLMAWADGTAQLWWIPNFLQNSCWAITKLSPFL